MPNRSQIRIAASYFGNRIARHAQTDMRRLRGEGFDIVVHTFSENDVEFYHGTIQDIVAISKDSELEVWLDPWGVGGIFGGEADSRKALIEPSWRQVSETGEPLPACCPNNPGFIGFIEEWITAACTMDVDAVLWDEPHFYSPAGCHCDYCKESAGIRMFLCRAMSAVRSHGKKNVVCLLPGDGAMSLIRDARFLENADNVGTTPFWLQHQQDPEACMAELAAPVLGAAQAAGKRTHLWIQGFKVPAGREFEITRAVTSAAKLGPDVLAIWGFDGCACMSALSCERPEVAWQSFLAGLRQISESS